uniref:Putative polyprotein n=1 Tax=Phytophthora infestans TaxID=4787 RepID=Q572F2_PHYIN|nr:putative polyprotein [Phytophthora infestans]
MGPYDMVLGMPWLEKHEPRIDWRGKAIGASRPAQSDRALVSHVSTSVSTRGAHKNCQGTKASGRCLGVVDVYDDSEDVLMVTAPRGGAGQVGKLGPHAGHLVPQTAAAVANTDNCVFKMGNRVLHTVAQTLTEEEGVEHASCVGTTVTHEATSTSDVGAPTSPGVVSFLTYFKAGKVAEMVLMRPETNREELNSSSYADVVNKHPPTQLPPDRGVRHEIVLVPGTKYCVTRQWPLPREQCEVIDAFFATKAKAGMVREAKSPHSTPTFCLVHAYNKLNNATMPAPTPIPRKAVLLNNMAGSVLYSALDLVDGYYQILMRESDIPLTAVNTPSGMLWEWLVMPQGLSNAPATFNRLVMQLFRPLCTFVQTYFDDIFVHNRAEGGKTAMDVHLGYLRRVLDVMRANKLYDNIDKCVFASPEIKVLGCFSSMANAPIPEGSSKVVGLGQLPSQGYAGFAKPLSGLLHKDVDWRWEQEHQDALIALRPVSNRPLSWPCRTRRSYLASSAMPPITPSSVHCCRPTRLDTNESSRSSPGSSKPPNGTTLIYTDHASLRTATNSPHLSQRMARWLSFFAEYTFRVEYKLGKLNVLADALSRRPDYELAHITRVTTDQFDRIRMAYRNDEAVAPIVNFLTAGTGAKSDWLSSRQLSRFHRYELKDGLLYYRVEPNESPRVVVPNDEDLKLDILAEAHDAPSSGHLGREKTFLSVSQAFWWTHGSPDTLRPVKHVSGSNPQGTLRLYYRACPKMVHLAPVPVTVTGEQTARMFVDGVFRYHGLPETIVSNRDPRFTAAFWKKLFPLLGTRLQMSTADHPQTDDQTDGVNRVLEDTLRSVCAAAPRTWTTQLPVVALALSNAVHASTGLTPFYLNSFRHPSVPLTLRGDADSSFLSGEEARKALPSQVSDVRPVSLPKQVESFMDTKLSIVNRGVADSQTHLGPAPQSENGPQTSTRASEQAPKPRSGRQSCGQDRTQEGLRTNGPRSHTPSTLSTPGSHHARTSGSASKAAPDVATEP